VWQQSKKLKPEALLIYLGKHDLFNWNEQDVQSKDVSTTQNMPKLTKDITAKIRFFTTKIFF